MILNKQQVSQLLKGNDEWEDWVKPLQAMLP